MITAAILLAADDVLIDGVPVALLPWRDDETLIEFQVAQLQAAGVDVVEVVLGYEAERIIPLVALDNVEPIVNDRWREGAAGSLRVGATAVPRETETAIIVRVDEPRSADGLPPLARRTRSLRRADHPGEQRQPDRRRAARCWLNCATSRTAAGSTRCSRAMQEEVVDVVFDADMAVRIETADGYALARASGRFE